MPPEQNSIYDTFIDYEREGVDIESVADYQAIQQIAGDNFEMQKRTLDEVLSDRRFNVPEYQRLFSWRERHHRQLWSDLKQFIDADLDAGEPEVSDVFFSSMYFAVDSGSDTYEIIDGQQRLTSTHILLRAILEGLQNLEDCEFEDRTIETLRANSAEQIDDILYEMGDVMQGKIPRLTLNKHDDDEDDDIGFFEALISGTEKQLEYLCSDDREFIDGRRGDAMQVKKLAQEFRIEDELITERIDNGRCSEYIPVYDSNERLLEAYNFYRKHIAEIVDNGESPRNCVLALVNLSHYLRRSYHVGEFRIYNAAPDFRMQIFEILNDRGLELTKIDRIRAAVVNAFFDADDREEYVGKWEDIVVAFATDGDRIDRYLSVYLSIVDEEINQVGDASAELTNAFGTRNLETQVKPRLQDLDDAREFLDYAHELLPYYQHLTSSALDPGDLRVSERQNSIQEAVVRLNAQRMDQWRPFVLALYYYTDMSSAGSGEQLYETIDIIEKLNFRRLLVGEDPNVFQEVFLEAIHQMSLSPLHASNGDVYTESQQYLIDEIRASNPSMFAERFSDTITQAQSWNPSHARLLFGKITHQRFREEGSIVSRRLDMSSIHLEHVLPQSLIHDTDKPVWLREFFKLDEAETDITEEIKEFIRLEQQDEERLTEEQKQRRDSIREFITPRFVNDIGNFVLLRDSDNIKASDQPLAEKIPQYYDSKEDFRILYPNRYFTPEHGSIDREKLDRLLTQYEQVQDESHDRDAVDDEVVEYFNSLWTYEALKDRRVDLLVDILNVVELDRLEDEFGLESDPAAVKDTLHLQTDREFDKRLSMRTL